jgi:hypothetical protein
MESTVKNDCKKPEHQKENDVTVNNTPKTVEDKIDIKCDCYTTARHRATNQPLYDCPNNKTVRVPKPKGKGKGKKKGMEKR